MESTEHNHREKVNPPKESFIGDSIENCPRSSETCNGEKAPCIWCDIEKKSGKMIGDVTLAELTECSYGDFIFDFIADVKRSEQRVPQRREPSTAEDPSSPLESTPAPAPKRPLLPQCKHSFKLSGGRTVCLSTSNNQVYASGLCGGGWTENNQRPLTENNPLLMLIGTLADIFIAMTFTLTCWILITKTRDFTS